MRSCLNLSLLHYAVIRVRNAIPIVMGANIGTSVTNTIVSLMQATDRNEFRLAFAAATVHDMFNWLTVLVLLPLEVSTRYLENLTNYIMDLTDWQQDRGKKTEFLSKLTKPFTTMIIEVNNMSSILIVQSSNLLNTFCSSFGLSGC